jgi:hypothetical protein
MPSYVGRILLQDDIYSLLVVSQDELLCGQSFGYLNMVFLENFSSDTKTSIEGSGNINEIVKTSKKGEFVFGCQKGLFIGKFNQK